MTVSPFVIDTGYVKGTKIRFPGKKEPGYNKQG